MEKIFKVTSELSEKVNDKTTLEVTFDYEDGKNWNCQKRLLCKHHIYEY